MGVARQHEHGLGAFRVVEQLEQVVVARRSIPLSGSPQRPGLRKWCASSIRTTSGEFRNAVETLREVPLASEVGVAEDG